MTDFRIVDDKLRAPSTLSKNQPIIDALMEGKTVFVPGLTQEMSGTFYGYAKTRKRKLRTRVKEVDGVAGLVMWFEKPEEPPTPTS